MVEIIFKKMMSFQLIEVSSNLIDPKLKVIQFKISFKILNLELELVKILIRTRYLYQTTLIKFKFLHIERIIRKSKIQFQINLKIMILSLLLIKSQMK